MLYYLILTQFALASINNKVENVSGRFLSGKSFLILFKEFTLKEVFFKNVYIGDQENSSIQHSNQFAKDRLERKIVGSIHVATSSRSF